MSAPLSHVTAACFGLSYLLAFGLEAARLMWPRPGVRPVGLAVAFAGLVAHTAYLVAKYPTPAAPAGGLFAVAWVLAVFSVYGTVHHPRRAWAVFVWPVVVGLVGLAVSEGPAPGWTVSANTWAVAHGVLVLLAAVGVCVGFLASVMYLVQVRRVRAKAAPGGRFALLSLERLEAMNRRAVGAAVPLLTGGLALGAVLVPGESADGWASAKVVGTVGLWAVCVVLMYLRYAGPVGGRRLAQLTVLAFALLLVALAAAHPFAGGPR
jgi:ABC-type transport system involved in cytochrome c biogenesis permease subunit